MKELLMSLTENIFSEGITETVCGFSFDYYIATLTVSTNTNSYDIYQDPFFGTFSIEPSVGEAGVYGLKEINIITLIQFINKNEQLCQ